MKTYKLSRYFTKIIFILLCMISYTISARDYYVSPDGNNSNSGSESNPWKTINYAVSRVAGGDTVYVMSGNYYESVNFSSMGSASAPILFKGVGKPVIGSGANNVRIPGSYIVLDGFEIKDTNTIGVLITGSNNELRNCEIHHHDKPGVIIKDANNTSIIGGKIYDNRTGFLLLGECNTLLLDGIDMYSTGLQSTSMIFWGGSGSRNITLQNLKIHGHPTYGAELMPERLRTLTNVLIQDCHFYNNGIGDAWPFGNIMIRSGNLLMQRNVNGTLRRNIFERGMGWGVDMLGCKNMKVHNNLFLNNYDSQPNPVGPGFGLEVNGSDGSAVYNNTFYGNEFALLISYIGEGPGWPPGEVEVKVHNNIFYKSRSRDYREILHGHDNDVTIIMDTNLNNTNPRFVNEAGKDFHLRPDSPAINAGKVVGILEDYDGISRPQGGAFDMGMYEYCPSDCPGSIRGPDGYTYATSESGAVNISEIPQDIAYGQDGNYVYLENQTQDVPCTNTAFGSDPIPGVQKHCFVKESKGSYLGTPLSIPGSIEAENYDYGGAGVSYFDKDVKNKGGATYREEGGVDIELLQNGGYAIGYMMEGEWLEYTIDINQTGIYDFSFNTASPNGDGIFDVYIDGTDLLTGVAVPMTDGWDTYTIFTKSAELSAGEHVLRFKVERPGFNLDKIVINNNLLGIPDVSNNTYYIYPNPSVSGIFKLSKKIAFKIYDIKGKLLVTDESNQIDLSYFPKGIYILKSANNIIKLLK